MRSFLGFATRLYLVLTVLAGVPAAAGRSVLCVAPDGHVAIEVGQGRCADYPASPAGALESSGANTEADGCGDCVDVPMGTQVMGAAHRATAAASPQPAAAPPCVASSHGPGLFVTAILPAFAHAAAMRPPASPSRTTILRN